MSLGLLCLGGFLVAVATALATFASVVFGRDRNRR
jgi:hypothetical protein